MPKKKSQLSFVRANAEQQAVIDLRQGIFKVAASPGSGKSFCLVNRYVKLIEEGVAPQDILSLTFTQSAGKSMRDRAEALVTVDKTDRTSGWMTFHSLALAFCTQEREHFPYKLADYPLAVEPVANKIIGEVAKKYDLDYRRLRPWVSLQKRSRIRPAQAIKQAEVEGKDEKLALAYKAYDNKLRENGVLDFDSLTLEMLDLLSCPPRGKESPERFALAKRWSYKFVQADEAQDNDEIQWGLLQRMTEEHNSLVAVGDPGQNLYSFRGSSGDAFVNMKSRWPDVKTLLLSKNHRSTPQVVSLCKQCAPYPELGDKFYTENPDGPEPTLVGYPSPVDEAKGVISKLGVVDKDNTVSVLCRTNRGLRVVEDQLSVEGIKYFLLGKSGFWSQNECKAVLGYLQCAVFPSDAAVAAALRAPFNPSAYIKKTELLAKIKKDKPEGQTSMQFLSRMPDDRIQKFVHFLDSMRRYRDVMPHIAVTSIVRDLRCLEYYAEEETTPDNSPIENVQELIKIAGRFSSVKEFLDYTRRVSAATKKKSGVCLATIHAMKGGESDKVFLIAAQEGMLPHAKAESIQDERNVFYVGISRAKHELHISWSGTPSQFITPFLKKEESLEEIFA